MAETLCKELDPTNIFPCGCLSIAPTHEVCKEGSQPAAGSTRMDGWLTLSAGDNKCMAKFSIWDLQLPNSSPTFIFLRDGSKDSSLMKIIHWLAAESFFVSTQNYDQLSSVKLSLKKVHCSFTVKCTKSFILPLPTVINSAFQYNPILKIIKTIYYKQDG